MPICIECGFKLPHLYTTYSKADDRSLGKGVRLTQCPRCKRFADKYVEHDFVVLFIDLVLIKPQVYRHLLFNRLGREDDRFDPSIIRLGIILLLFDVYLTWARIEKAISPSPLPIPSTPPFAHSIGTFSSINTTTTTPFSALLSTQPIILQYLFFLVLCTAETAAFHLPIRFLLSLPRPRLPPSLSGVLPRTTLLPYYPHPSVVSTALLVSSFTKLFPLLLLIWRYDLPSSASAVSWAVVVNNVAALEILLDCGFGRAVLLAAVGAVCRGLVGWGILRAVGVGGGVAAAGVVETGDLVELWKGIAEGLGFG